MCLFSGSYERVVTGSIGVNAAFLVLILTILILFKGEVVSSYVKTTTNVCFSADI